METPNMFKESMCKLWRMGNRIVSFLPSATEILYELGAGDKVLAVTHECNFPPESKSKPRVIHSAFDPGKMSSREIDKKVEELMKSGQDIYVLDEHVLKAANPDLIIAQGICEVCSPHTREVEKALSVLESKPEVLILDPKNLDDIIRNILEVGEKVGRSKEAGEFVSRLQARLNRVREARKGALPKVLCIEWLDPLFTAGHWVPQMVELAGGINGISKTGERSRKMELDEVSKFDPDIVILMPCGFGVNRTLEEYEKLLENTKWKKLRAVKEGQVYAVNANEYFSKPGPRTVTGVEILAKIINPDTFRDFVIPKNSIQKIESDL